MAEEQISDSKEEKFRLIVSKTNSFLEQLALDECQMHLLEQEKIKPTLRINYFKKPAVVFGFFKRINEEINIENCKRFNVDVCRTLNNADTFYKEPNSEINCSLIVNDSNINIPLDLIGSYERIFSLISKTLENYNIKAEFKPLNEVLVNKMRIALIVQFRKKGVVLFNFSILISLNKEEIKKFLINTRLLDKGLTSLDEKTKNRIEQKDVEKSLIESFPKIFKTDLEKEELTKEELTLAEEIYKEKYSTHDWIYYK
ncbi:MAG: lipoate--protein ligase family protein [Candidatus Woesearchaeota archaeon]